MRREVPVQALPDELRLDQRRPILVRVALRRFQRRLRAPDRGLDLGFGFGESVLSE